MAKSVLSVGEVGKFGSMHEMKAGQIISISNLCRLPN
jgi:hypothetical protein